VIYSQDGTSEEFIGEWAEKRGIRDQLFIATKVCVLALYSDYLKLTCLSVVYE
jgi:aryl-alcohol dehydrogenase-like predicted oxidoreductase